MLVCTYGNLTFQCFYRRTDKHTDGQRDGRTDRNVGRQRNKYRPKGRLEELKADWLVEEVDLRTDRHLHKKADGKDWQTLSQSYSHPYSACGGSWLGCSQSGVLAPWDVTAVAVPGLRRHLPSTSTLGVNGSWQCNNSVISHLVICYEHIWKSRQVLLFDPWFANYSLNGKPDSFRLLPQRYKKVTI